jgi:hypothetical protein
MSKRKAGSPTSVTELQEKWSNERDMPSDEEKLGQTVDMVQGLKPQNIKIVDVVTFREVNTDMLANLIFAQVFLTIFRTINGSLIILFIAEN